MVFLGQGSANGIKWWGLIYRRVTHRISFSSSLTLFGKILFPENAWVLGKRLGSQSYYVLRSKNPQSLVDQRLRYKEIGLIRPKPSKLHVLVASSSLKKSPEITKLPIFLLMCTIDGSKIVRGPVPPATTKGSRWKRRMGSIMRWSNCRLEWQGSNGQIDGTSSG